MSVTHPSGRGFFPGEHVSRRGSELGGAYAGNVLVRGAMI